MKASQPRRTIVTLRNCTYWNLNTMESDLERGLPEQKGVNGFPILADFIASDEDKSTTIYRRFDRMSARNILYLQSELVELEERQRIFDREDITSSRDNKRCAWDWSEFKRRSRDNPDQKERMNLVLEIRKVMKEYSEATQTIK